MMFMPVNRIMWQSKITSQKIPSVYKYATLKIVVTPSFNSSVVAFLIMIFCSAIKRSVRRHGFHCCSSPPPPPGRLANSSQNCCPCSFCSHKQRCLTVLSELWSKVTFNSNTFFLNWKQWTAVKAVEDALQYIKMYEADVSAKTAKEYLKIFEEQVIRLQSKVWSNL